MRFEGRTAVITGGAIGFGRAFGRALIAEGASVVIADIDVEMAERTAAQLVSAGGHAIAVDCDVADPDRVDAAIATTIERLGTMDGIVSAMLFLCSDEASFITGETIKVSGGYPLNF